MTIPDDGDDEFICLSYWELAKTPRDETNGEGCLHTKLSRKGEQELNPINQNRLLVCHLQTVLFLCTHNSARSQMAEAFLNYLCGNKFKAESAGITPTRINPHVKRVMAEIGIDLSMHRSKSILEFQGRTFDFVVTVCDQARELCPFFPGENQIHKAFPDPSSFMGTAEETISKVRQVRDEIRDWVSDVFCKGSPHANAGLRNMQNLLK